MLVLRIVFVLTNIAAPFVWVVGSSPVRKSPLLLLLVRLVLLLLGWVLLLLLGWVLLLLLGVLLLLGRVLLMLLLLGHHG